MRLPEVIVTELPATYSMQTSAHEDFRKMTEAFKQQTEHFGFVFSALFLNDIFCFFASEKSLMTI